MNFYVIILKKDRDFDGHNKYDKFFNQLAYLANVVDLIRERKARSVCLKVRVID